MDGECGPPLDVVNDQTSATSAADRQFMLRALRLAEGGRGRVAPNPLVGAVVVRDGRAVGEGYHTVFGGPHAEVVALRAAGEAARGATLYVTLEPCSHSGKTPPCTAAIIKAGVQRVVFASADPNRAAAGGAAVLRASGITLHGGVEEMRARDLNGRFFHRWTRAAKVRPWTELKLALSLDARIADVHGHSAWMTGEAARAEVHRQRADADAVAVGVDTVLSDDPWLTVRGETPCRTPPVRVVFDRHLRLPLESVLASTARETPVWAVCAEDPPPGRATALESAGIRLLAARDLVTGMRRLVEAGIEAMLVEGGAKLAAALLQADVVDRLQLFYAPLILGAGAVGAFDAMPNVPLTDAFRWRRVRTRTFGADTLLTLSR